jgi:putative Mg2+ transporter-C (MgtC) family protein
VGADLSTWDIAVRLLVAAALAGALGLEREADGQEAGFRTHLLLALGAAVFGVTSVGAFDGFVQERADTNIQVDVTRIASYVAAGVGFIGAGTILKGPGGIRGLTTAASLWTVAAIGLASGVGFWQPALIATVIALVSLTLLRPVRTAARRLNGRNDACATLVLHPGARPADVVQALGELQGVRIEEVRVREAITPGQLAVQADVRGRSPQELRQLLEPLRLRPDVEDLTVGRI